MTHVISSQPSSTSPYQPTETREALNGNNPTRSSAHSNSREDQDGCCFRADKDQCCLVYYCCSALSCFFGGIRDCTDSIFDCCENCLIDCCEDKPDDKRRSTQGYTSRYQVHSNRSRVHYNNYYDDNTWDYNYERQDPDTYNIDVPIIIQESGLTDSFQRRNDDDYRNDDNDTSNQNSNHISVDHCVVTYHTITHGSHHINDHHTTSDHYSSHHDSGGNDDSGGYCDSGWGADSGGGDTGGCDTGWGDSGGGDTGGCDSGWGDSGGGDTGGCDSGGGGCDD